MHEDIPFGPADQRAMHAQAQAWIAQRKAAGDYRARGYLGELNTHLYRMRGEWAVADSLGLERPCELYDPGWDFTVGTVRMGVRYRSRVDGLLMNPDNLHWKSDLGVLVVATDRPHVVRIVGGTYDFPRQHQMGDFGYGPTQYMDQSQLTPWDQVRDGLLALL